MLPDIESVPAEAWKLLAARRGAWRTPVLASVTADGRPDARTVVLRTVSTARRELVFFTDRRSPKHAQLSANPSACLVIHDPGAGLQLRLYGSADVETRNVQLDAHWEALDDHQRAHYAQDAVEESVPGKDRGRENFAVFRVRVDRFHCLRLSTEGNAAAEFTWEDGQWKGRKIRP